MSIKYSLYLFLSRDDIFINSLSSITFPIKLLIEVKYNFWSPVFENSSLAKTKFEIEFWSKILNNLSNLLTF